MWTHYSKQVTTLLSQKGQNTRWWHLVLWTGQGQPGAAFPHTLHGSHPTACISPRLVSREPLLSPAHPGVGAVSLEASRLRGKIVY